MQEKILIFPLSGLWWKLLELSLGILFLTQCSIHFFIISFCKKILPSIFLSTSEDQEIPDSLKPRVVTTDTARILGVDKSSLISEAYYKYGVLIQEPDAVSVVIASFQAPKLPTTRSLSITPITGYALETTFVFTFPIISGVRYSDEVVKLIVVSCDGSQKIGQLQCRILNNL